MADSGGHWETLAEAQKLTESTKIPGVIETDVKRGNPLDRMPVAQAAGTGKSVKWLREEVVLEDAVLDVAVGEKLTWTENVTYEEMETALKRQAIQRKLDKFVRDIYGTYNDYRAQMVLEMEKGLKRKVGDRIIYGDITYGGAGQFDGFHALAGDNGASSNLNIDQGETGLSLNNLRTLMDAMPLGVDEIWMPYQLIRRLSAAYEERGFAGLKYDQYGALGSVTRGLNDVGKQILFWDGTPIIRTDFLVAEEGDTGLTGTSLRAKYSSSPRNYSLFAVKYGNIMERNPGICLAFGGTDGAGDFYKLDTFPTLENFDAEGIRMVSYNAVLLGSPLCLGRIVDIVDEPILV